MEYKTINLNQEQLKNLVGINDSNIMILENLFDCGIVYRDDTFKLLCDDTDVFSKFSKLMDHLIKNVDKTIVDEGFIKQSFIYINEHKEEKIDFQSITLGTSHNGKPYRCKTLNQYNLYKEINNNDLVFAVGPAGTGKTFIGVLMAVNALKKNLVNKIIITRPAVEAGESLGFLPGDLKEKIDPYLMPIYDALDQILGKEQKDKYVERGIIEVIPLAYMRGRTLDEAFIILDEAQNTTDRQMLMFLTRLGFNSKMLVNGDVTQIDLNINKNNSGLIAAINKLKGIDKISFVEFNGNDVVRNPLVQTIIEKYRL